MSHETGVNFEMAIPATSASMDRYRVDYRYFIVQIAMSAPLVRALRDALHDGDTPDAARPGLRAAYAEAMSVARADAVRRIDQSAFERHLARLRERGRTRPVDLGRGVVQHRW